MTEVLDTGALAGLDLGSLVGLGPTSEPAVADTTPVVDPAAVHVESLVAASGAVLEAVRLLNACRFGPSDLVNAAVNDLGQAMMALDALGPRGGHPALIELETDPRTGSEIVPQLGIIRSNVLQTRAEIADLSLELRRLLADTREVMSTAMGSVGTYDAHGRTMTGPYRRGRGQL